MTKKQTDTGPARYTLDLDPALRRRLRLFALDQDVPASVVVRTAIENMLATDPATEAAAMYAAVYEQAYADAARDLQIRVSNLVFEAEDRLEARSERVLLGDQLEAEALAEQPLPATGGPGLPTTRPTITEPPF